MNQITPAYFQDRFLADLADHPCAATIHPPSEGSRDRLPSAAFHVRYLNGQVFMVTITEVSYSEESCEGE